MYKGDTNTNVYELSTLTTKVGTIASCNLSWAERRQHSTFCSLAVTEDEVQKKKKSITELWLEVL